MTKLYEARQHILIRTGYSDPVRHCHMAAHIILSMDGDMTVTAEGEDRVCRGAMIPSGVSHMVDTRGNPALVFLYDCTTETAKSIRHVQSIPPESCRQILAAYAALEHDGTAVRYGAFERFLLSQLGLTGAPCPVNDERITSAMQYIRAMSASPLSCRDAAGVTHLSQSRFSHLFKEQVGMTFSSYLIYQRLMRVYAETLRGRSITEAALEAGFSSSAHFADVNRRVFGIPASTVMQNLVLIRVQ